MRILVTGGAGFIGSHVADAYLEAGHEVAVVDNLSTGKRENLPPRCSFFHLDLLDEEQLGTLFQKFQPHVVSHHAARVNVRLSWEQPVDDARVNILGSLALFRQMVNWRTPKIIFASSGGAVYGEPERLPATEEDPIQPLSNYGVSKFAIELYLRSFKSTAGFSAVVLRYPNVYGPRQVPTGEAGVVAVFTTQLLRGERPRIFGDGSKTRDYVYVDDIVDANLLALESPQEGTFNLGWGQQVSDREVFETVCAAVGSRPDPILDKKRPGEIDHTCLDASRAHAALGWEPRTNFREGVARTVSYWQAKPDSF